jgi:hypothetical protein
MGGVPKRLWRQRQRQQLRPGGRLVAAEALGTERSERFFAVVTAFAHLHLGTLLKLSARSTVAGRAVPLETFCQNEPGVRDVLELRLDAEGACLL